jgi:tetratricopeptide (TPR) repeat protein
VGSVVALVYVAAAPAAALRLRSRVADIACGLVAGGAGGNLLDRVFRSPGPLRGAIVDWLTLSVRPQFYPKAAGALATSLRLNTKENYLAMAGQAALQNSLHNFVAARGWALRGIGIDAYNSTLYGALADAETQLGHYAAATRDVDRMNQLLPGAAAFTRASYVFELRGDDNRAALALKRALKDAVSPADKAFAQYYLAELGINYANDLPQALAHVQSGLLDDPTYIPLRQERARIEAAQGDTKAALADYAAVVAAVPQPQYVLEYGELLQSFGRKAEAEKQYDLTTCSKSRRSCSPATGSAWTPNRHCSPQTTARPPRR